MEYSCLEKLVLKAMETISNYNYTNGYIRSNKSYFKRVLEFAKIEPTFNFNQATEKKLIHFICGTYRLVENNLSIDKKDLVHRYIRAFHILESIYNNESIKLHYKAKIIDIPNKFKPITEQYSNWLRERLECQNTINTKTSRLLTFLFIY